MLRTKEAKAREPIRRKARPFYVHGTFAQGFFHPVCCRDRVRDESSGNNAGSDLIKVQPIVGVCAPISTELRVALCSLNQADNRGFDRPTSYLPPTVRVLWARA